MHGNVSQLSMHVIVSLLTKPTHWNPHTYHNEGQEYKMYKYLVRDSTWHITVLSLLHQKGWWKAIQSTIPGCQKISIKNQLKPDKEQQRAM